MQKYLNISVSKGEKTTQIEKHINSSKNALLKDKEHNKRE